MAPVSAENVKALTSLTRDPPDIENLLALNPRIKPYVNVVPTVTTKKVKKHWKRNEDKNEKLNNCGWVMKKRISLLNGKFISMFFFRKILRSPLQKLWWYQAHIPFWKSSTQRSRSLPQMRRCSLSKILPYSIRCQVLHRKHRHQKLLWGSPRHSLWQSTWSNLRNGKRELHL